MAQPMHGSVRCLRLHGAWMAAASHTLTVKKPDQQMGVQRMAISVHRRTEGDGYSIGQAAVPVDSGRPPGQRNGPAGAIQEEMAASLWTLLQQYGDKKHLSGRRSLRVLDIGAGDGKLVSRLAARCPHADLTVLNGAAGALHPVEAAGFASANFAPSADVRSAWLLPEAVPLHTSEVIQTRSYPSVHSLLSHAKELGAGSVLHMGFPGLSACRRLLHSVERCYETLCAAEGEIPSTYHLMYGVFQRKQV
ncbi:hypothetical protein [Xylanibacillus composti]|nr:hypothetical protein [Xylanibacillus composti]